MQKKYIAIYSKKLAGLLMVNGHPLKNIAINPKMYGVDIYIFKNTELLREIMEKYNKKKFDYRLKANI